MSQPAPPPRGICHTNFTSRQARNIVRALAPNLRAQQEVQVWQALIWHQEHGESLQARYCILMLDALRNSSVAEAATSATMLDAFGDGLIS